MLHIDESLCIMRCINDIFDFHGTQMPYFDSLQTIRERAGVRVSSLAKSAGVDRSTITRIEKHHNSTPETLHSIINALNNNKSVDTLDYEDVVTETSEYGGK